MLRIVVFAGIPGPKTAIPFASPAGAAEGSVIAVEPLAVVVPPMLSAPAVLGFNNTLPLPLFVRPPEPVTMLLIVRPSPIESARTMNSFAPSASVPPLMVATPPPPLRRPPVPSVSVVPGAWATPFAKLLPLRFSVAMERFPRIPWPEMSPVTRTCVFALATGRAMPVVDVPCVKVFASTP